MYTTAAAAATPPSATASPAAAEQDCHSSPCLFGGRCEAHDGTFTCFCTPDRTGDRCERRSVTEDDVSVASFDGGGRRPSFVELRPLAKAEHKLSLEIEFRAERADGMLVYAQEFDDGSGDYVALVLSDGYVGFCDKTIPLSLLETIVKNVFNPKFLSNNSKGRSLI